MTRVGYARCAAGLPIVFPLLGYVAPEGIRGVFGILAFATWTGGLPYLVCVAGALWCLRGRPVSSYWRLARLAPPVFAVVMWVVLCGVLILTGKPSAGDLAASAAALAVYGLTIGYLYVLVAWAGYRLLHAAGAFHDAPSDPRSTAPAPER